jgi:hypothetical protein
VPGRRSSPPLDNLLIRTRTVPAPASQAARHRLSIHPDAICRSPDIHPYSEHHLASTQDGEVESCVAQRMNESPSQGKSLSGEVGDPQRRPCRDECRPGRRHGASPASEERRRPRRQRRRPVVADRGHVLYLVDATRLERAARAEQFGDIAPSVLCGGGLGGDAVQPALRAPFGLPRTLAAQPRWRGSRHLPFELSDGRAV